ncbi:MULTISPECIES: asparagine synthase-related protein [Sphingobium]|uniref:asparagine synthase (glutamine-hydrolyzing) n=1 Tax=Sphingobium limneticum TaxID=1007511 RepID=A0A5J5HRI2_9SPHN|nr:MULTISPECIES: asparagine synthetase B family protein [Sphingobium]KAA9011623.1 hypothetical protein F4U94_20135 [Sphingobium limneticum]KAA9012243.1 hypothetical protein F4U96_21340 [Sphingobium limneticum]KAA9024704.1 hypothetical protein F4U95_21455 [Sphingobium limneticum]
MAVRYLLIIDRSEGDIPPKLVVPAGFTRVEVEAPGTFYINDPAAFRPGESGDYSLLGLFFSGNCAPPDHLETGRTLLQRGWGAFVAFRADTGGYSFIRDPSGQLPCFFRTVGPRCYIASDIDLLRQADGRDIPVDWDEVSDTLLFTNHFADRTALLGITELLPGQELRVDQTSEQVLTAWTPWDHVTPAIMCPDVAVTSLRNAFDRVFQALASHHQSPIITVSGGLDSSIVALGMSQFSDRAKLFTFFTHDDPLGDERHFAKDIAHACSAPLIEAPYRFPDFSTCCRTEMFLPRPTLRSIAGLVDSMLLDQAFVGGHSAILGGYGGDNVFAMTASGYALRDCVESRRPVGEIVRTMRDLRRLTAASYLDLGRHAARVCISRQRYSWPREVKFLSRDAASKVKPVRYHPWMEAPDGALSGSRAHIAAIIRSHNFLQWFPRTGSAENLSPLLMAPIMEACLSIPSWIWCADGRDRSIARRASPSLPQSIAYRKSKGSPVALHTRFFETYRRELSDLLCDGMLVKKGIADRDAIFSYCALPTPVRDLAFLRILEIADVEIWCRQHSS